MRNVPRRVEKRSGAVISADGGTRPAFAALTASNAFTRP
jgi:hypothetical protein